MAQPSQRNFLVSTRFGADAAASENTAHSRVTKALQLLLSCINTARDEHPDNSVLAGIASWNSDSSIDAVKLVAEAFLCRNTQDDVIVTVASKPLLTKPCLTALIDLCNSTPLHFATERVTVTTDAGDEVEVDVCGTVRAWAIKVLFVLCRAFKRTDTLKV